MVRYLKTSDHFLLSARDFPCRFHYIPFGDGPGPMFKHRVAKTMIMNMLNQAEDYVYMMSPYLIIDNELCQAIENAALRELM